MQNGAKVSNAPGVPSTKVFKGYASEIPHKYKYGFPFKVPQLIEELDEDGIHYLYTHRCREDQLVVPYNLEILLFWGPQLIYSM